MKESYEVKIFRRDTPVIVKKVEGSDDSIVLDLASMRLTTVSNGSRVMQDITIFKGLHGYYSRMCKAYTNKQVSELGVKSVRAITEIDAVTNAARCIMAAINAEDEEGNNDSFGFQETVCRIFGMDYPLIIPGTCIADIEYLAELEEIVPKDGSLRAEEPSCMADECTCDTPG